MSLRIVTNFVYASTLVPDTSFFLTITDKSPYRLCNRQLVPVSSSLHRELFFTAFLIININSSCQ